MFKSEILILFSLNIQLNWLAFQQISKYPKVLIEMGSLDKAVLTGFICRLCSEMHRVVLHIYGEQGIRLSVSEKISRYLSINVSIFRNECFFYIFFNANLNFIALNTESLY